MKFGGDADAAALGTCAMVGRGDGGVMRAELGG